MATHAVADVEVFTESEPEEEAHVRYARYGFKTAPAGTCFEFVNDSGHKRK